MRPARPFLSLCLLLTPLTFQAAEPSCAARLDHSFVPPRDVRVPLFVNSRVHLEVAPDDKIILAGDLTRQPGVLRLQADGQLDTTFQPFTIPHELGEFPRINSIALQTNGGILVAGWMTHLDRPLIRLDQSGSLDGYFNPQFERRPADSLTPDITAMAQDAEGKIYVTGDFTHVNNIFRRGLARLHANGDLDESFAPNFLPNGDVLVSIPLILPYTHGSVLVVVTNTLLKLESSGAVSQNFTPFNSSFISAIATDAENRILVGHSEDFNTAFARLLPNGEVDNSFSLQDFSFQSIGSEGIISIKVQPDAKILIGGSFTDEENRTPAIARFLPNGTLDDTFRPFIQQNGWADDVESVTAIGFQSSGKIIIGGDFAIVDGTERSGVARLYKNAGDCAGTMRFTGPELIVQENAGVARVEVSRSGDLQAPASVFIDFIPSESDFPAKPGEDYLIGETKVVFAPGEAMKTFELPLVDDGNIEIAEVLHARLRDLQGGFTLDGTNDLRITIKDDDSAGLPGIPQDINYGSNITVFAVEIDGISRAMIAGSFTNIAGHPRTNVARLASDGSVDGAFVFGVPFIARAIHIINGYGPVLVGGDGAFWKLHPNGARDETFNVTIAGVNPRVSEILMQPDGKIVIGGKFTSVNGVNRHGLARLHANGDLDLSFDPPGGIANISEWHVEPTGLALQADGNLIVGGDFLTVGGFQNYALVRLDTNGVPDQTYAPRINGAIGAILLQSDGKLVIGGDFDEVNQRFRRGLARLTASGALDETFLGDAQIDNRKYNVTELHEGWEKRLYVAGRFNFIATRGFDSIFSRGVARFNQDGVIDRLFYTGAAANGDVFDVGLGLDNSVLVGGSFTRFNGEDHEGLVRLHGDSLISTGRISFAATDFAGTEGETDVRVRLVRQWGTNGTISASYRTHGGAATPGIDYEPASGVVTFLPGEQEKEILVRLHDDNEVELWEGFQISLADGPLGLIPSAWVFPVDNEKGFVFEKELSEVQEGETVTVRLLYTGQLDDPVLLTIQTVAGSAVSPSDYAFSSSLYLATHDNLPITISIPTVADGVDEPVEEFTVQIVESSQPVLKGPPARVRIRDWNENILTLSSAHYSDGQFTVSFSSVPGSYYSLYVSSDLENWSFLDRLYSFDNLIHFADRTPPETSARFYRIEEDPSYW